jgi:hypothetical protein
MDTFEHKINEALDCNIAEEADRLEVIEEGMMDKVGGMVKKALSMGVEKVLPREVAVFAKKLIRAAKQSKEAASAVLEEYPEYSSQLMKLFQSGKGDKIAQYGEQLNLTQEDIEKDRKLIKEAGSEEVLGQIAQRSTDIAQAGEQLGTALGYGAWAFIIVVAMLGAIGVWKTVKVVLEVSKKTNQRFSKSRTGRRR